MSLYGNKKVSGHLVGGRFRRGKQFRFSKCYVVAYSVRLGQSANSNPFQPKCQVPRNIPQ